MWESCWANYLTDYFHLFLCLAIICVYADDVIAQDLRADEMLLHFSSLGLYRKYIVLVHIPSPSYRGGGLPIAIPRAQLYYLGQVGR